MADKQSIRDAVADLTWADLYTRKIRKEIKSLIPIVKTLPNRPSWRRAPSNCARSWKIRMARSQASRRLRISINLEHELASVEIRDFF